MVRLKAEISLIFWFFKVCTSIDSALYTAEKQTRRFSQPSEKQDVVKPVKSRSPTECILKCRIQLKESFYVDGDEENCYCVHNNQSYLSSITRTGDVEGVYFDEHLKPPPMKSCKDIRRKCQECLSGYYNLDFGGKPTKVYCDMETDNGGWTLIGNMTFEDSSKTTEMYNTVVKGNGQLSSLSEAPGGRFLLNSTLLGTLSEYTGFKELRIRCFKPWHGRTVHVVMKGDYVLKALTQSTVTHGLCGDGQLRFLSDDNSVLSLADCQSINCGWVQSAVGIYDHLLYFENGDLMSFVHVNNADRMECDDRIFNSGFEQAGSWTFYVR